MAGKYFRQPIRSRTVPRMKELPILLENCVDDAYAQGLLDYIKRQPFHFVENVNGFVHREKPKAPLLHDIDGDIGVFVAGLYSHGQPRPDFLLPLIETTARKLGMNVGPDHLIRAKANILPPLITKTANRLNLPHTDTNIPHVVFLYYLNDCDGDTVIFNQRRTAETAKTHIVHDPDLAIARSFTPRRNSMLVFEGSWYHTSTVPTQGYRMVININLSYPGRIADYADPASWGTREP
jgi:hypothetical protein